MATILHISADFPDAIALAKTRAVANLLALVPEHTHHVYSLNRRLGVGAGVRVVPDRSSIAVRYAAPPFGLALRPHLMRLADWIAADIERRGLVVDAIHAHKMAIEGLVAERLGARLRRPYAVSLWGNTDVRYLRLKPGLRSAYRRVLQGAAAVAPAAPWTAAAVAAHVDLDPSGWALLPIVTMADAIITSPVTGPRLVSAFSLDHHRMKGAEGLLAAFARLRADPAFADATLDIIGGGQLKARSVVKALVARHGVSDSVRLLGPVPHEAMQPTLATYAAFVMPTVSETYGMVYIEALLAGVPLVYSAGRGIDGYLDGLDVAISCDPASVESIAAAMAGVLRRQSEMKAAIARHQQSGTLERFRRPGIARTYSALLNRLIGTVPPTRLESHATAR